MTILNRGTGLLVIEVRQSNPNGDPDAESDPRTLTDGERGLISPVSFKRKLRDLVLYKDGPAWAAAAAVLGLGERVDNFGVFEARGRDRGEIGRMGEDKIKSMYWDARVFGSTFLEKKAADEKAATGKSRKESAEEGKAKFISTGTVQFGAGISVAPVAIERMTMTNFAGVEDGKDRGMAPLGWRVVDHGIYVMPFFVNPMAAGKSGCTAEDVELMKFLLPHVYRSTASAMRPFVDIRHVWYAEHKTPLGSCPDAMIIDAMTPVKHTLPDEPSRSLADYTIPTELGDEIRNRLAAFTDLGAKDWVGERAA
ncbi:type I CRISPR-associated protein Cas7 [Tistrella mobilis]